MTTPQTNPPKRRRGAPPGNSNALKHGFYARHYRKSDIADLDSRPSSAGLQDEINLLRVYIRRVVELSHDAASLPEAVSLLRVLSLAATSLTRLIRTQSYIASINTPYKEEIEQALSEVLVELGITGDQSRPP